MKEGKEGGREEDRKGRNKEGRKKRGLKYFSFNSA